jgi:hypothetical protein
MLNDDVAIGFDSTILVDIDNGSQLSIEYTELLEESRCPPNSICTWEGFVKVKLKLDDQQYVELGIGETTVDSVQYNDHMIRLFSVEYDSDDDFGDEKKSSVVILVD